MLYKPLPYIKPPHPGLKPTPKPASFPLSTNNIISKQERDSSQKVYIPPATKTYALESAEVDALEWNGREIRNALQTAVALAEAEAVEEAGLESAVVLADRHLRAVVRMSAGFKEFLGAANPNVSGDGDGRRHGQRQGRLHVRAAAATRSERVGDEELEGHENEDEVKQEVNRDLGQESSGEESG
jgi:hypothetical protein